MVAVRFACAWLLIGLLAAFASASEKNGKDGKASEKVTARSLVTQEEAEKLLGSPVQIDAEESVAFTAATYAATTNAPSLVVQLKPDGRKEFEQLKKGFEKVAETWKDVGDDAFCCGPMAVVLKKDYILYLTVTADTKQLNAKFVESFKKVCTQAAERVR